jgi:hypothetical protein
VQSNREDAVRLFELKPLTETKKLVKATLIAITMHHAIAGMGYAAAINDMTLKARFGIKESTLLRSTDTELGNLCMNIYIITQSVIGSMAAWGITSATVSDLLNNINTFNTLIGISKAQSST